MKANGNFSDTSVEQFYSVKMKADLPYVSPCGAVDPCNSLF